MDSLTPVYNHGDRSRGGMAVGDAVSERESDITGDATSYFLCQKPPMHKLGPCMRVGDGGQNV